MLVKGATGIKIISIYSADEIDRFVQEKHNSSALAMELRLSCTNQSKYSLHCTSFIQK